MAHGFGWHRSNPDQRDYGLARLPRLAAATKLPPHVDLRETGWVPPVKDQGNLGSCTAHGITSQLEYEAARQGEAFVPLSRLWLYWQERNIEGTVASDAGANPRDGFKVANRAGVPAETEWPYDTARYRDTPPEFADEAQHRALVYAAVPQTKAAIKRVLAAEATVGLGFTVYESFESDEVARTGMVPMPGKDEAAIGGHYVYLVGYRTIHRRAYFLCRNSWGESWGDGGDFCLPTAYVANPNLSGDLWSVQQTT